MSIEKVKIEDEATKASYALGCGVEGVVSAINLALADGWQIGTDLPVIVVGSIQALAPAVAEVKNLSEEAHGEPEAFTTGLLLPIKRAVFKIVAMTKKA